MNTMRSSPVTSRGGPLAHLTVVDLTQHLAGPFASQILGDLGARIIKIEPLEGDSTRGVGPHFVGGDSAYYLSVNRNKESICIDLKAPGGTDAVLALVAKADVVLENFRPGTLTKLGLDYDVLRAVNPKIVVCSISGFGQDGPYRDLPAFDIVVQAMSGGMALTGEPDGRPVRSGLPIGDLCAGMYGVIGTLAGLLRASTDGVGSYVDVAMLDTQVSLLSYVASYYLLAGQVSGPQGRGHMSIPTYRAYTCSDGQDVVVAAITPRMWRSLCVALEVAELSDDELFRDNDTRRANRALLDTALEAAIRQWPATEVLRRLAAAGVPAAPINGIDTALNDPQVRHREMILDLTGRDEMISAVGNPVKISHGRAQNAAPPRRGEHTELILRTVAGLNEHAIACLAADGVIPSDAVEGAHVPLPAAP